MFILATLGIGGGLGLLLFGVRLIRSGLEGIAQWGIERVIGFFAGSPLRGVAFGTILTAAIQSSSVTTTLVVAMADARVITLRQAIAVILGANIGTTATIQLFAFNATRYAPAIALVGLGLSWLPQGRSTRALGRLVLGVAVLFLGLGIVSKAALPITAGPAFHKMALALGQYPFLGMLCGAAIAATLHSSGATIAIAVTACAGGRLDLKGAIAIIAGANVGTCATAIVAAAWASVAARRAAAAHLIFNMTCATLCMTLLDSFVSLVSRTSPSVAEQVANAHTFFNVAGTIIVLPAVDLLARLIERLVPDV